MFHVSLNILFYPCCKYEIREGASSSLPPSPYLGRLHKLQGEFRAYIEETIRKVTPRILLRSVLRQKA